MNIMSIDSEYQLFGSLPPTLLSKIERNVYNRRKRRLSSHRESLRKKMASSITFQDYFIVDNIPLEVSKLSRSSRSQFAKKNMKQLSIKAIVLHNRPTYYGYKLYAVCAIDGVFTEFDLPQASIHGIHFLKNIRACLNFVE